MYDEPKDIGMIGEALFAAWASQGGFAATKVAWDKYGHDFIIQARPSAGARRRLLVDPPIMSCLVQVKTTRKRDGYVDIALSNLHALATNPMPAFLTVVVLDDDDEPCEARAVHIDRGWVERITKRIVELPLDERDRLHKKTLRCDWSEDGASLEGPHYWKSLVAFIQAAAGSDGRMYAATKNRWNEEAGYGEHPYRVGLTLPSMAQVEANDLLARFAVGLLDKLPVANLTIREVRFDQEEMVRDRSGADLIDIQFSGDPPSERVEVTVRAADGQEEAVLPATLRVASAVFSFLPVGHDIWRFSSKYIDIVLRPRSESEDPEATFSLSIDEGGPLAELARAARAFRLLSGGGVDVLVRLPEQEPVSLGPCGQARAELVRGSRYRQAIEDADRIVRLFGVENVVLTDGAVLDAQWKDLRAMVTVQGPMNGELSARLRLQEGPDAPELEQSTVQSMTVVHFAAATIEGRTFCQTFAIEGRPVLERHGGETWVAVSSHVVELLGRHVFRGEARISEVIAFAAEEAARLRSRTERLVVEPALDQREWVQHTARR